MSEPQDYPDNETEDQLNGNRPLSPEEQRERLRRLILQGKERGYITYAEINDALPDDMSDAEHIDGVVNMIQGLGIQVTEEAPDADISAAPPTPCGCICSKWVRWSCSRVKTKSKLPKKSKMP